MKTRLYISQGLAALILFVFASCTTDETVPVSALDDYTLLTEQQIPGTSLSAKIFIENDSLIVGYNRFEIELSKTGFKGQFTDAEIHLKPMMNMGTIQHACPVENPEVGKTFDNVFGGAVVFVMPSGDMGSWVLTVEFTDKESGEYGKLDLTVVITLPEESKMKSFTLGTSKYFVSLVNPVDPKVGINNFEITIHKKNSMMEWPASGDFIISMAPEMPDMGHGSPNNVNPVCEANGHYKGKVNFTMDGYWKINLELDLNGEKQTMDFDVTF